MTDEIFANALEKARTDSRSESPNGIATGYSTQDEVSFQSVAQQQEFCYQPNFN